MTESILRGEIETLDPTTPVQVALAAGEDPLWYKDAIIYQLHVKAFFDSTGDGVGDFAGLAMKLDYLVSLGVSAVWLLPFYPSPLKDDGYDIADYKNVHPAYGTVKQFRDFVRAAHKRGLKVITELVVNHTSDQHPWFQRARLARRGSVARNYYVWSDDDKKFSETRIIFVDTETSNWAWDSVAEQYYWHRFFSHQPDLNYDNPRVIAEVLRVMKFWLEMGVDGLRLDAIPYLVEREGTNNENLAETHEVVKKLRGWLDKHYPGRMLLGEANQWPEDVLPYFGEGEGDECNMAFHFPLMPRMYMALAREDRHPVTDIMRQTPDIPAKAQWAVFLRNHDELTLEMVTDRERDYLWHYYASDPRARINLGIRRRLAPLVENDRRKIELLNSLLMSMPGTPIIYYGDEIGMGDNIYLGDRDGVRTPMQWSPDRNGGFSRADPQRLYLPPVMDPIYGFEAVNVEAQSTNASSLLNWMRRLIVVRKQHRAFGRGTLRFLYPGNRKVLAYLRQHDDEIILCVANLSRGAQPAELNLSEFAGLVPVELIGRTAFPPIGALPYFVTLPAYGFYWFLLASGEKAPSWHEPWVTPLPEFVTLVETQGWQAVVAGAGRKIIESQALPEFMPNQRWYAAKGTAVGRVDLWTATAMAADGEEWLLAVYRVATAAGAEQAYFLPFAKAWETRDEDPLQTLWAQTVAKMRKGSRVGAIFDATSSTSFAREFARNILCGREIAGTEGSARFVPTALAREFVLPEGAEAHRLGKEQSNTSLAVGDDLVLKFYRRLEPGVHPEVEVSRFLSDYAGFANTPPVFGHAEMTTPDGGSVAIAILQGFVRNQGDGWEYAVGYLDRALEEAELADPAAAATPADQHAYFAHHMATLGQRIGEMHRAFVTPTDDPDFAAEPISERDLAAWAEQIKEQAQAARRALEGARRNAEGAAAAEIDSILDRWTGVGARVDALLAGPVDAVKARYHGDLHLGQVVVVKDDFYVLDFEGEPARSIQERRRKHSLLRDIAGMLRSFDYAAWAALFKRAEIRPDTFDTLLPFAAEWRASMSAAFMQGYLAAAAGDPAVVPHDPAVRSRVLDAFILEKACYEVCYEVANRPSWLRIPLQGVMNVLTTPDRPEASGA